jgi:hypothetical protein
MMDGSNENHEVFRDCVSAAVLAKSIRRPTKQPKKRTARGLGGPSAALRRSNEEAGSTASAEDDNPAELAEFIEVASNTTNDAEYRT